MRGTFGVSAMFAGVGGALGVLAAQFVSPFRFTFFPFISLLVGIVVGEFVGRDLRRDLYPVRPQFR
ncbi:hypothetical protein [Oryzicola mucosus]|uniref:Uncharacterized protein n=1 Tax=Oryzicola mucosus TaxID=2767425 RepID=A0A8J6U1R4_9HYPH|nr:hypothetical protein [Oryzicola mucosus]MBD0417236.1 hypothetical protein [Oryzicola mucosus]